MSEDAKIHFLAGFDSAAAACGHPSNTKTPEEYAFLWSDVTCGACKLERPMQKPAESPEYRTPANVREVDTLLAEVDRLGVKPAGTSLAELKHVVRVAQLLEQAKACQEHAAMVAEHWEGEERRARDLVRRLETTLSASLAEEKAPGVGTGTPEAFEGAQTDVEALSEAAQSALIDAEGGVVRCDPGVKLTLWESELTNRGGRLTPKGWAARTKLVNRRLDLAFGPLA